MNTPSLYSSGELFKPVESESLFTRKALFVFVFGGTFKEKRRVKKMSLVKCKAIGDN